MSFGVDRPVTSTWPVLPPCFTASAAPGKATEVIPKIPRRPGNFLIRSWLSWKAAFWSSPGYLVATSVSSGYFSSRSSM